MRSKTCSKLRSEDLKNALCNFIACGNPAWGIKKEDESLMFFWGVSLPMQWISYSVLIFNGLLLLKIGLAMHEW
jgi:hypothetical protein